MKILFPSHNLRSDLREAQAMNLINICIKYGFDILIISGSYSGQDTDDTQSATDNARGMA